MNIEHRTPNVQHRMKNEDSTQAAEGNPVQAQHHLPELRDKERRKGPKDRRINPYPLSIDGNTAIDLQAEGQCDRLGLAQGNFRACDENRISIQQQITWSRDGFDVEKDICEECLLKLELPLLRENGQNLGTLWLVKDLKRDTVTHYTLHRIEHLRRTLISTLTKLQNPAKR